MGSSSVTMLYTQVYILCAALVACKCISIEKIENAIDGDEVSFLENNPEFTPEGHPITEGDIAVDPNERAMTTSDSKKWPLEVKYTIADEVDADAVRQGLQYLMNNTCLTFTQVNNTVQLEEPHMQFISGSGCWSYVGKLDRNGQPVSIGPNCRSLRTVVHETMHALGFFHEQSRTDRDLYVEVFTDNILDGKGGNFNKKNNDRNFSAPYDYTSAMHYRRNAFSENGLPTIGVFDYRYEDIIGKMGPSHNDLLMINSAYECAAHCSGACENGGYMDQNCECVCPTGSSGSQCENVTGSYYPDVCYEQISQAGVIQSPDYPDQSKAKCFYEVVAPEGQRVEVIFDVAKIHGRNSKGKCKKDSIGVRLNQTDLDDEIGCGTELQGRNFTSVGNKMVIKYSSTKTNKVGFQATINFVAA